MADTPRRGRSRGASPARSPATPANAYWLRNRTPRELAALGSPALPDTPTYNLRNRVVARDEPPPRRMSTSERLADALARAKAASVDFTVVAWEAGVRGVRRTVRWWNGAGWALRAAMACWAVALVLAFFPTRMFSSNKDIIVPTTDATEELPQCGVDEEASPGLLAGDGTDFMSLATNATRAAAATAAAPAKPSSIPLFTLIEPQPASLGQAYAADPIIVPPELPKPKPRIISEHTQLASVVSDKTSPTFVLNAPGRISTWIGDLYEWAIGKRLVLAAGGSPDAVLQGAPSCWPMKGSEGKVMLSFARPIQLDSVRLDHPDSAFIPSSLLYFTSGTLVANATVDPGSNSTTAFAQDELVDSLEVEIRGQLGSKYTCLGRFHVFGQLAEAAEV